MPVLHVLATRQSVFATEVEAPVLTAAEVRSALESIDFGLAEGRPAVAPTAGRDRADEGIPEGAGAEPGPADDAPSPFEIDGEPLAPDGVESAVPVETIVLGLVANRRHCGEVAITVAAGERVAVVAGDDRARREVFGSLTGLDAARNDVLEVNGRTVHKLSSNARAKVLRESLGIVSGPYPLLGSLTLKENLLLPLALDPPVRHEHEAEVSSILQQLGLEEAADWYPDECEREAVMRALVGRALVRRPPVVLVDAASFAHDPACLGALEAACGAASPGPALVIVCAPGEAPPWTSRSVNVPREIG